MIGAERGAAQHGDDDRCKADGEQRPRRPRQRRDRHQQRQRNDHVIGQPLFEAQRTGRQPEHEFEIPGADDGRGAQREDRERRRGGRLAAQPIDKVIRNAEVWAIVTSPPPRCNPQPLTDL